MPSPTRSLRRPLSTAEVRAAEAAVVRAEAEWDRAARRVVSDAELVEARRNVDQCRAAVARLSPARLAVKGVVVLAISAALHAQRLGERIGRAAGATGPWWPATTFLVGVLAGAPVALWGLVAKPSVGGFLFAVGMAVAAGAGCAAALLNPAVGRWLPTTLHRRHAELASLRQTAAAAARLLADWRKQHDDLRWVRGAQDRVVRARKDLDELRAILANERYQLLHTDWRSLRGVPFEQFLERVFATLGYQTQTTKTSGDQGVDLMLSGKGPTVAVQTKGYEGSVGNKSVQEA